MADSFFLGQVFAIHSKCSDDNICEHQLNDHRGPLAANDLCVSLYLTNAGLDVARK